MDRSVWKSMVTPAQARADLFALLDMTLAHCPREAHYMIMGALSRARAGQLYGSFAWRSEPIMPNCCYIGELMYHNADMCGREGSYLQFFRRGAESTLNGRPLETYIFSIKPRPIMQEDESVENEQLYTHLITWTEEWLALHADVLLIATADGEEERHAAPESLTAV